MIPRTEDRNIESNLPGETKQFTILASGKAFQVLIDGLYSNKIRSIIRELWTNAFDAHVAAGKRSVPFECSLPTSLSPEFSVRDFGTSMTHEMVMSRYSTLFDSTKDATNEQVGYLGLGSKSPFAYTDSFTVTAWLDGEKRVYTAVLNKSGVPSITLLGRSPSDEPQGLRVSFSASPSDQLAFRREASSVAIGFDVPPISEGVGNVTPVHVGAGWKLFTAQTGFEAPVLIRQGCVVYPYHYGRDVTLPPGHTVLVDVPVGSVEVTASRESLSLTPDTAATIKGVVQGASDAIQRHFLDRLSTSPTLVAAAKRWKAEAPWLRKPTWKGVTIPEYFNLPEPLVRCRRPGSVSYYGAAAADEAAAATTTNVRADELDLLKIVIDNGTPIVRRRARLADFGGPVAGAGLARRSGGSSLHLVASPAQAADLVRDLELSPAQFIMITDLPDPGPTPRAQTAVPAVPTTPFLWGMRSRKSYTYPSFGVLNSRDTGKAIENEVTWVLRNVLKNQEAVHYYTPRQVERLNLDPTRRVDFVVAEGLRAMSGDILRQHEVDERANLQQGLYSRLGYGTPDRARRKLVEMFTGSSFSSATPEIVPARIMELARILKLVGVPLTDARISDTLTEIRKAYPLIFSHESLADFYITATQAAGATTTSTQKGQ